MIISSAISAPTLLAQEKPPGEHPEGPPEEKPWWKEKPINGTFIFWDKEHNTSQDSWSWLSQAWEFGPYPSFTIYLQNGTEVTDSNYIPLDEPFKIVIDVKKTIFTGNMTLGRAGINWHTKLRTKNGTETGYAHCRMVYINEMVTPYWNESDTWHVESFVFNKSETLAPPGEPLPPMEKGGELSFYNFDENATTSNEWTRWW